VTSEGAAAIAVEVDRRNGSAVVTVGGELEFGTAAALRTTLSDLAQEECDSVVIDLAAVGFIDSTGLSLLVQAKQRFESLGREFRLRAPIPRVARVFEPTAE
jgi:stage II sporulation protein AA (anti-sigma F factor antagonist)